LCLGGLALAWLLGTAAQLQQPVLWPVAHYLAGLASAAMLWLAARRRFGPWPWLLVLACAAFMLTGLRAQWRLADELPAALEGQDLQLTGVVAELPRPVPEGTRFVFEVESALWRGRPVVVPQRVSLGWYRGWHDDAWMLHPGVDLRAGQRWRLTARLKQPHGSLNPHGFDYELWLFEQGIRATGYVRANAPGAAERLDERAGHPIERWRQQLRDAVYARVSDPRAASTPAALALGDQSAIARDDWDVFRATGVAHLMSISGLHVTMFAWLAGGAIALLWRRSARLMLACPALVAGRWGGVGVACAYALLAGWGVPAQRTVWMLATAALLASLGLRWPWLLVLAAAALVVGMLDPWALLQPGFWLSFTAVGLLLASDAGRAAVRPGAWRQRALQGLRGGLRTQWVASLGLAPLGLVFFQQVSLVGFVANLVAIPLVTLLVTPLALLGALWPALWLPAAAVVDGLVRFLGLLAAWPAALWTVAAAPAWAQAGGLLGGLLLVLPLPWRVRLLGALLWLPLLLPPLQRPAEGRFELLVPDVGQGSAVLLRTRDHLLVYDSGPRYSSEQDAADRVLLPLLRARGERRIDLLMLSHRDSDHVGGAATLLEAVPVALLSTSLEPAHPLLGLGRAHRRCDAGQRWRWDGVDFEVLHPPAADHGRGLKPNHLSCVLRVQDAAGRSVLLAGDIEAAQEAALVAERGAALASQVLLVPHHGSRTSSSEAFLDAVAPRVAVAQAGYRNRFGHPAPTVLARYAARGTALVRSDACGAWTWTADGAMSCLRDSGRRYWQHRPDLGHTGR
jgi:competence protein ComEC